MLKKNIPSKAQAKFLARAWGNEHMVALPRTGYVEPTLAACVKRGWLQPTGESGEWPNGTIYDRQDVSPAGFTAIEFYLREVRVSGE